MLLNTLKKLTRTDPFSYIADNIAKKNQKELSQNIQYYKNQNIQPITDRNGKQQSLIDLAFAQNDHNIQKTILKSGICDIHTINGKTGDSVLSHILNVSDDGLRKTLYDMVKPSNTSNGDKKKKKNDEYIKQELTLEDYGRLSQHEDATNIIKKFLEHYEALEGEGYDQNQKMLRIQNIIKQAIESEQYNAITQILNDKTLNLFNQNITLDSNVGNNPNKTQTQQYILDFKTTTLTRQAATIHSPYIVCEDPNPIENLLFKIQHRDYYYQDQIQYQESAIKLLKTLLTNTNLNTLKFQNPDYDDEDLKIDKSNNKSPLSNLIHRICLAGNHIDTELLLDLLQNNIDNIYNKLTHQDVSMILKHINHNMEKIIKNNPKDVLINTLNTLSQNIANKTLATTGEKDIPAEYNSRSQEITNILKTLYSIDLKEKDATQNRNTALTIIDNILIQDLPSSFLKINHLYTLFAETLDGIKTNQEKVQEERLKFGKILIAHCFWRQDLKNKSKSQIENDAISTTQMEKLLKQIEKNIKADDIKQEMMYYLLKAGNAKLYDTDQHLKEGGIYNFLTKMFNSKNASLFQVVLNSPNPYTLIEALITNTGFAIEAKHIANFVAELSNINDNNLFRFTIQKLIEQKKSVPALYKDDFITQLQNELNKKKAYIKQGILYKTILYIEKEHNIIPQFTINLAEIYKAGGQNEVIAILKKYQNGSDDFLKKYAIEDNYGNTLLHLAAGDCNNEHIEFFKTFFSNNIINVNKTNKKKYLPIDLFYASQKQGVNFDSKNAVLNNLLALQNPEDVKLKSPVLIAYASNSQDIEFVKILLQKEDVEQRKVSIRQLLLLAADNKDYSTIEIIIKDYPNIYNEIQENKDAQKPLFRLLERKDFESVKTLLANQNTSLRAINPKTNRDILSELMCSNENIQDLISVFEILKELQYNISQSHIFDACKAYLVLKEDKKINDATREAKLQFISKILDNAKDAINQSTPIQIFKTAEEKELYYQAPILCFAAANGDKALVETLLQSDALKVNECATSIVDTNKKIHPIMIAYKGLGNNEEENKAYIETIGCLLGHKDIDLTAKYTHDNIERSIAEILYADPKLIDYRGKIEEILQKGSSIDSAIKERMLFASCKHGRNDFAMHLLNESTLHTIEDENKLNLIDAIVINFDKNNTGQKALLQYLLDKVEQDQVLKTKESGNSTLHYLVANCDKKIVELAISKLKATEKKEMLQKDEVLIMAAYSNGDSNIIEYLQTELDFPKVPPTIKDKNGNTVLHYVTSSSSSKNSEMLKSILQDNSSHVNLNTQNAHGLTPLALAISNNNIEMLRLLLQQKDLDPNIVDKNGNTPLMVACALGKKEFIIELLNDNRVDATKLNNANLSALMISAYSDLDENILDIMKKDQKDSVSDKILNIQPKVRYNAMPFIMQELIQNGADPMFGRHDVALGQNIIISIIKSSILYIANKLTLSFNPILESFGKAAISWNFASNIGNAVAEKVINTVFNYLDNNKIDLSDTLIIGNYHIDNFGNVISGAKLRDIIATNTCYQNAKQSIATLDDLKNSKIIKDEHQAFKRMEIHNCLVKKYKHIQKILDTKTLLPWTRWQLKNVVRDIIEADKNLQLVNQNTAQYSLASYEDLYQVIHNYNANDTAALIAANNDTNRTTLLLELLHDVAQGKVATDVSTIYKVSLILEKYQDTINVQKNKGLRNSIILKLQDVIRNIKPWATKHQTLLLKSEMQINQLKKVHDSSKMEIENLNRSNLEKKIEKINNAQNSQSVNKFSSFVFNTINWFGYNNFQGKVKEQIASSLGYIAGKFTTASIFALSMQDNALFSIACGILTSAACIASSTIGLSGIVTIAALSGISVIKYNAQQPQPELKQLKAEYIEPDLMAISQEANNVIANAQVTTALEEKTHNIDLQPYSPIPLYCNTSAGRYQEIASQQYSKNEQMHTI